MERGWAFEDVGIYWRWASESSAREYIRLGQTAWSRLHSSIPLEVRQRCDILASGCAEDFDI